MKPVISIGNQDFKAIREHNCFYIDKTNFIKEWWENEDYVTLITRPRRFGKTLNINTIECFFSNQYSNRNDLFDHLSIWGEEKYQKLQGTYPVISLSFSGVNGDTFASIKAKIMDIIIDLYTKFDFLQQSNVLNAKEKEYLNYVNDTMSDNKIQRALYRLSFCLSRHYNKKVISGYLKVENIVTDEDNEEDSYQLSFTNFEVQKMFKKMIQGWFSKSTLQYNHFVKALLLQGDNMV